MVELVVALGAMTLWVNYWRTADLHARLAVRFQAPTGETTRYTYIDPLPEANKNQNADDRSFKAGLPEGFVWAKVPVNIEYPGTYTVSILKFDIENPRGIDVGKPLFAIKDLWVSDDPAFDPEKNPVATDIPVRTPSVPGFVAATHHDSHVSLNTAVLDTQKRLPFMLMECYQHFSDSVNRLNLGMWWTAWEQCGTYDYGETSRKNFRKFLVKNYGTIKKLNAAWHTTYKTFDEIEPGL